APSATTWRRSARRGRTTWTRAARSASWAPPTSRTTERSSPVEKRQPIGMRDRDQLDRDAAELSRLGYAQQLLRSMGCFSHFALSFPTTSILTGAVTLYGHGLRFGGPFEMAVGWPLVTVMTLAVAASLAELASAYPTAGALYHWSALLGGRTWGWFT